MTTGLRHEAPSRATPPAPRVGSRPGRCNGFTLIEVLIAAVILIVSMTGLLTIQLTGVKLSQNAYHRTQATNLAYQMTDYLRTACATLGDYDGRTLCAAGERNPNDGRDCEISTADQVASHAEGMVASNLSAWLATLQEADLAHWFATIRINPARPEQVQVVVQWDDTRATEAAADSSETKTSCMGVAVPTPMEEICLITEPCPATL